MLFPQLGRLVAERIHRRAVRATVAGTAALTLAALAAVGTQVRLDWLAPVLSSGGLSALAAKDPTAEGIDWTSLRDDLGARGLLPPGAVVGVPNWRDAGKIARGLGPEVTVLCLSDDPRHFAFAAPPSAWAGRDVLLLVVDRPDAAIPALVPYFAAIEPLPPSRVTLRGRVLKTIGVAVGRGLRPGG